MTDERPAAQEAIWRQLRSVEPPATAKQRVHDRIEQQIARKPRWIWLAAPALAAAVVAIVVIARGGGDSHGPVVVAASSVTQGDRAIAAGEQLDGGAISVHGSLRVALDRAAVEIVGPATVALSRERVDLIEGKVSIDGAVDVKGPSCSARVHGKSSVELRQTQLVVTVFAGSAEILPPQMDCQVFELPVKIATAKPTTPPPPVTEPPQPPSQPEPATLEPAPPPIRTPVIRAPAQPPKPSDLASQTDAYRAAHALRERDPAGALAKLRELVRRWPRAAIRHEIDLGIIDALVRLGRTGDARTAARKFLRDHPTSARSREMRVIAGAP